MISGLGVELIISILKLLKPNTVIQIQSSDNQNNYPFHLTPNAVNNKEGFRSMKFRDNLYYEFWTINSSAEINHKRLHR